MALRVNFIREKKRKKKHEQKMTPKSPTFGRWTGEPAIAAWPLAGPERESLGKDSSLLQKMSYRPI